jgi:Fe-S cluster assembly protein SufD
MSANYRNVSEEWRRAPRALMDRTLRASRAAFPAAGSVGDELVTAKVALYARLPESAERAGASFRLEEAPPGAVFAVPGIAETEGDAEAPAGYAALVGATAGLRGTLSFPAGYDAGAEYVTVTTTVMKPLSCPTCVDADAAPPAVAASLAIEVGPGARASVFLQTGADEGVESLLLSGLGITVAEGASLDLFVFSEGGPALVRLLRSAASLARGARLSWTEAVFDAGSVRSETRIDLDGEGAASEFYGAYGARGRTERERVVAERHRAPRTTSRAVLKSVLRDESRLAFRGLIEVFPEAPGTDAYLSNRNLILDDGARAESLPQLKIDQDDVACSHGSATGGPREEELFYLMSRGLDRNSARSMIALGHLGSVLDRAPADLAPRMEAAALRAVEDPS